MAAPTPVTIKLRYGGNLGLWVRRTVEHPGFGYVAFRKWALESFPNLDLTKVRITYKDEEGDECAINNNRDFREATELYCHLGKSLRIELVDQPSMRNAAVETTLATGVGEEDGVGVSQEEGVEVPAPEVQGGPTPTATPPPPAPQAGGRRVSLRDVAVAALQEIEEGLRNPQPDRPFCHRVARSPLLRNMVFHARDPEFMGQLTSMGDAVAELVRTVMTVAQQLPHPQEGAQEEQEEEELVGSASTTPSASSAPSSRAVSPVDDVVQEGFPQEPEQAGQSTEENSGAAATQEARETQEAERPVHHRVMCDGCGVEPMVGVRYKDAVRRNYDLCEACEARDDSPYPFLVITDPTNAPSAVLTILPDPADIDWAHDNPPVHLHVSCNVCGEGPILGTRYKCTQRDDYDLCAMCQREDRTGIPLLKIKRPSQAPARIQTYAPGDRPPRGFRRGQHQRWREYLGRPNAHRFGRHGHFHPLHGHYPNHHQHGTQQPRCSGERPLPVKVLAFEEESQQHHDQQLSQQQPSPRCSDSKTPVSCSFTTSQEEESQQAPVMPVQVVSAGSLQAEEERLLEQAVQASLDEMAAIEAVAALSSSMPSGEVSMASSSNVEQQASSQQVAVANEEQERGEMTASVSTESLKLPGEEEAEEVATVSTLTADEAVSPTVANAGGGQSFSFGGARRYGARFIRDKTIPDGTVLPPRTRINKTWVMQNHGSVPFPDDTRLVFSYGHLLDGPGDGVLIGSVQPEEVFEVTVTLVTPRERGQFIGYWHLEATGEDGQPMSIGSRVWVDVMVDTSADGWQFVEVGERLSQSFSDDNDNESDEQMLKDLANEVLGEGSDAGGAAATAAATTATTTTAEAPQEVAPTVDMDEVVTAEVEPLSHSMEAIVHEEGASLHDAEHPQADEVVERSLVEVPVAALEATHAEETREEAGRIVIPEPSPEVIRWSDQLHSLFDMGFEDVVRNVRELEKHYQQGGLDAVVEALLTL